MSSGKKSNSIQISMSVLKAQMVVLRLAQIQMEITLAPAVLVIT